MTRAAIFAGATLLVPACGKEPAAAVNAPPQATLEPIEAPPPPTPEPTPTVVFAPIPPVVPADTSVADAERAAADARLAAEDRRRRRDAARLRQQQLQQQLNVAVRVDHQNARPYGAPPRRDDFV